MNAIEAIKRSAQAEATLHELAQRLAAQPQSLEDVLDVLQSAYRLGKQDAEEQTLGRIANG